MLQNCYQEPQELFFLQKREVMQSPTSRCTLVSPSSRPLQKKSLRTLKSVRSQKSFKTLDSETPRDFTAIVSLKFLEEEQITKLKRIPNHKESSAYWNPVKDEKKQNMTVGGRIRIEKKLTYTAQQPAQRVSIRFGDPVNIRRFLSPEPVQATDRVEVKNAPLTPDVPSLYFSLLDRESQINELKEETLSITIYDSPDREQSKEEKDWDMKSTHHVDRLQLPIPSTAKSTVSMLSDRSETDSVVMDHLPLSGKLTKLV